MSDYQKALEAARRIKDTPYIRVDPPYVEVQAFATDALMVARMFLRNHAISHGEKPE